MFQGLHANQDAIGALTVFLGFCSKKNSMVLRRFSETLAFGLAWAAAPADAGSTVSLRVLQNLLGAPPCPQPCYIQAFFDQMLHQL